MLLVSGFALEWIEIYALPGISSTSKSPASRWSGLKFILFPFIWMQLSVSGFALEWIEIYYMATYHPRLNGLRLRAGVD